MDNNITNSFLKQEELIIGTSYIHENGGEYLYIGKMDIINPDYPQYRKPEEIAPTYIKLTNKERKEIKKYDTLNDFLYARFSKNVKHKNLKGYYISSIHSLKYSSFFENFVSKNIEYFDSTHIDLKDMEFKKPDYYDEKLMTGTDDDYTKSIVKFYV